MAGRQKLIDDVEEVLPSVVQIVAEGYDRSDLQSLLNPRYRVPLAWAATGFFIQIEGKPGYILTNSHAVIDAEKIKVKSVLTSEELFSAELVGCVVHGDPDIALLKLSEGEEERFVEVSGFDLPHVDLGDSQQVKRGMKVKAIGYPFGMPEPNVSGGELSNFLCGDEEFSERLVTDAAINPGNSGGPAVIEGGKVIGINTSIIVDANNISFITPINFFKILLPTLLKNEQTDLTCLGADFQPNSKAMAEYLGQERPKGVIISRLIPGGMLAKAGIRRGDVLLKVDDFEIDAYGNAQMRQKYRKDNLWDLSRNIPLGKEVAISYFREGEEHSLKCEALAKPSFGIRFQPAIQNRKYMTIGGMLLQELSYELVNALSLTLEIDYWREVEASKYTEQPFLVVTDIDTDTQADRLFLQVGEIVHKVNGKPFTGNLSQFSELLQAINRETGPLLLEFRSGSYGYFSQDSGFEDLDVKTGY